MFFRSVFSTELGTGVLPKDQAKAGVEAKHTTYPANMGHAGAASSASAVILSVDMLFLHCITREGNTETKTAPSTWSLPFLLASGAVS